MTLYIYGATVLTPDERIEHAAVVIEHGRIAGVEQRVDAAPPAGADVIDGSGLLLAPGYIDLQLNGAFGDDFTANPHTIWNVARQLPRYGVTAFLPTIITSPPDTIAAAQQVLGERPPDFRGTEPLGLHLEGPFLNGQKKGAHNPAYLRAPDLDLIADWSSNTGVRLVTLAPELPGALDVVRQLAARGVVVSAGHSMATYDEAQRGFEAGVRYGTHLFNAMPMLHHRDPALPGALLSDSCAVIGLIPDGIHVHPALIKLIWQIKGRRGVNVVSDAIAALAMPPGTYHLNDLEIIVTEHESRLPDGTIAGSIVSLDQAVRNVVAYTGCAPEDAIATATSTPADVLHLGHERGRVQTGYHADLVLLTPELKVITTIVGGNIVYRSE
jgi:N-acetylglucosamine-6-phosphate deacetylase